MANKLVFRVQSSVHGTKRVEVRPNEALSDLWKRVLSEFKCDTQHTWNIYKNRDKTGLLDFNNSSRSISSLKLKNGDMLYLHPANGFQSVPSEPTLTQIDTSTPTARSGSPPPPIVVEDEIDRQLAALDGKILRKRDEQYCRHGASGSCFHCAPLDPFSDEYLSTRDPPIKFLSFQSYIRKLHSGVDRGKFVTLENISCRIKPGCTTHKPWPDGICSKCQPTAVTLNRQTYRHVDYVSFENRHIMDAFIDYWRQTGCQRAGLLLGRYELHDDFPLAVKATVAAIYEPPQESSRNGVALLDFTTPGAEWETAERIAATLGLRPVGWIFTDLVADDLTKGTVRHFRGTVDTHFLSAQELVTSAALQNRHPNPCRLAPDGHFGSKFVTVVVTGEKDGTIGFTAYQVSAQGMALVHDACLVPTLDAPELCYVKESSPAQYVPDVFYKKKDEYGNTVTLDARPLPNEYLLVDMGVGFPLEPQFTFLAAANLTAGPQTVAAAAAAGGASAATFTIENRNSAGQIQDFDALTRYLSRFGSETDFLSTASDFHLLLYFASNDMLNLKSAIDVLLAAVGSHDRALADQWAHSPEWATVQQLILANAPSPRTDVSAPPAFSPPPLSSPLVQPLPAPFPGRRYPTPIPPIRNDSASALAGSPSLDRNASNSSFQSFADAAASMDTAADEPERMDTSEAAVGEWSCEHCTMLNAHPGSTCEMCGLPKADYH